eukprot:2897499-Prymnesium_polylepis.1
MSRKFNQPAACSSVRMSPLSAARPCIMMHLALRLVSVTGDDGADGSMLALPLLNFNNRCSASSRGDAKLSIVVLGRLRLTDRRSSRQSTNSCATRESTPISAKGVRNRSSVHSVLTSWSSSRSTSPMSASQPAKVTGRVIAGIARAKREERRPRVHRFEASAPRTDHSTSSTSSSSNQSKREADGRWWRPGEVSGATRPC